MYRTKFFSLLFQLNVRPSTHLSTLTCHLSIFPIQWTHCQSPIHLIRSKRTHRPHLDVFTISLQCSFVAASLSVGRPCNRLPPIAAAPVLLPHTIYCVRPGNVWTKPNIAGGTAVRSAHAGPPRFLFSPPAYVISWVRCSQVDLIVARATAIFYGAVFISLNERVSRARTFVSYSGRLISGQLICN